MIDYDRAYKEVHASAVDGLGFPVEVKYIGAGRGGKVVGWGKEGAEFAYYPGRIFEVLGGNPEGRFLVFAYWDGQRVDLNILPDAAEKEFWLQVRRLSPIEELAYEA